MKIRIFILIVLFSWPFSSQALGLSVSPAKLEKIFPDNDSIYLVVDNISSEPIRVSVFADDFNDFIKIIPSEFNLAPEEKAKINIFFDFNRSEKGVIKTDISIVSQALDKKSFNAASGIKVPLILYFNNQRFVWSPAAVFLAVFFGLLFVLVLIYTFSWITRPRKKKDIWHKVNFLAQPRRFKGLFFRRK